MPTKPVTVQYRYVNIENLGEGYDLQSVVTDVLSRAGNAGERPLSEVVGARKKDLDQDNSYVVLNQMSQVGSGAQMVFCGELIYVRAGKEVPGLQQSIDDDVPFVQIANLTLGAKQSLVDGVLYFGLVGNHLALIEGQRARGRTLERYLTRLLQDAGEMEPGVNITLNPRIEGLKADSVSKIMFKPPKATARAAKDGTQVESRSAGEEKVKNHTVLDVLRAIGVGESEISGLESSIPPDGWIEGLFTMAFKQKGGKKGEMSRSQFETFFRNVSERDLGLIDPDGASEKRGSMKLSHRRDIEVDGALLDQSAAMQEIVDMLVKWASQGKIDLTF